MNKGLLSGVALGALLLPVSTALAADPVVIIPVITPVIEIEEERPVAITLIQRVGLDTENDEWIAYTGLEVDAALRNGMGVKLNVFNEIVFEGPPEFGPGFRVTLYREFGNFTLGAFGGIFGEDMPGGDWFWELGLAAEAELGPVELEVEAARVQEFGNPPFWVVEAEAGIHLGERITIIPGIELEFTGGPPDGTLALTVEVAVTDRLTIAGGVEKSPGDNPFFWGGFEIAFGGNDD